MRKIKTNEKSKKNIKKNMKKNIKTDIVESEISLKKIAVVSAVIIIIFVLFYLLTTFILNKEKNKKRDYSNYTLVESSKNILLSDIYNQPEDKYYVLTVMDDYSDMYDLYLERRNDIYYINPDNAFNKSAIGDETVVSSDARDIRISDTTLFVIENHELLEYAVGYDDVITYLRGI